MESMAGLFTGRPGGGCWPNTILPFRLIYVSNVDFYRVNLSDLAWNLSVEE
jgi:hypothetical protein